MDSTKAITRVSAMMADIGLYEMDDLMDDPKRKLIHFLLKSMMLLHWYGIVF